MFFARVVLLLGLVLAVVPVSICGAHAQQKLVVNNRGSLAEIAFRTWLNSFEKGGIKPSVASLKYDEASDTLFINNLKFPVYPAEANANGRAEPNAELAVGTLALTALKSDSRGVSFEAGVAEDLQILSPARKEGAVRVERLKIRRAFVPDIAAFVFDSTKPISSQINLLRLMTQFRADEMTASKVSFGGGISLAALKLNSVLAGKISLTEISSLEIEMGETQGSPIGARASTSQFSADSLSMSNVDLEPYIRMFEPSAYLDAGSARPWGNVVEALNGHGIEYVSGTSKISIANARIGPIKLRQFSEDLTEIFNLSAVEPDYLRRNPLSVAKVNAAVRDAFRLEEASFQNVALGVPVQAGFLNATLSSVDLKGFGADKVDQLRLRSLTVVDPTGDVSLTALDLSGIDFPPPASTATDGVAPALTPTINVVSAAGLRINTQQINVGLENVNLAMSYFIGATPTKVNASIEGLKLDTSQVAIPAFREALIDLGYKNVDLSLKLLASWEDSSSAVSVDAIEVTGKDVGTFSVSGAITGVTRASFENPQRFLLSELSAGGIRNLRFSFENGSLIDRLIEQIAKQNGKKVVEIKQLLSSNMPSIMAGISSPDVRNKFIFAAISFINDPQVLAIASSTPETNAIRDILSALADPYKLPTLLKLDASANSRRR